MKANSVKYKVGSKRMTLVVSVFCSLVLLFSCSLVFATTGVGSGIETTVKENEFNRAAAQLRQKASDLDQRQRALDELENELAHSNQRRDQILLIVGLSLFGLIGVNYYLDFHRRKQTGVKL
jgi:sensor histidine kinase YesM